MSPLKPLEWTRSGHFMEEIAGGVKDLIEKQILPPPGGQQRARMLQRSHKASTSISRKLLQVTPLLPYLSLCPSRRQRNFRAPCLGLPASAQQQTLPWEALVRLRRRKSTKRGFRPGFESSRCRGRPKASRGEGNAVSRPPELSHTSRTSHRVRGDKLGTPLFTPLHVHPPRQSHRPHGDPEL